MDSRKYLLILVLILTVIVSNAQQLTFQQVDSTSNNLYKAGDFKQLVILGTQAKNSGIDYPVLRERVAYANFITADYSAALNGYNNIISKDSYNQIAQYYAYLCQKYLNHDLQASYHAAHLDTVQQNSENISNFGLVDAGFEVSIKSPNNTYRGTASYERVSLTNRLSWRLQLEQSVSLFDQTIDKRPDLNYRVASNPDEQWEYYAKLTYSINENLTLMGAYHYLNTNYQSVTTSNNVGVAGIKYTGTYFDLQGDFNWGYLIDHHLTQYNGLLMLYPWGNLNFYTISRLSQLNQNGTGQTIFNQSVGFKVAKNTWLETSGTFGNLDNYIDADGLYIYNTVDASKLKLGETVFYLAGKHAQLRLNYTYEKKQDDLHNLNYNQNSVTAGMLWKF